LITLVADVLVVPCRAVPCHAVVWFGGFSKKFQNFQEYVTLYPEYSFVFIGDNGQGDLDAAKLMMHHYRGRVKAVFIQRVAPVLPETVQVRCAEMINQHC
jgi:phosphatidate phosphatase APP1